MTSNDTKRDVFEKALREWDDLVHICGLQGEETHGGCEFDPVLIKYKNEYDDALPENLTVIPKYVSEYINDMKLSYRDIWDAMHYPFRSDKMDKYMEDNSEIFARAWLDGYQVEEEK